MSVRIYVAFSGNNSGTYTLLGSLEPSQAEALCDELRAVFEAQQRWVDARGDEAKTPSPLHELAAREGIETRPDLGAWDDWPQYGPPPEVARSAGQVMVHVPYTASFPSLVGALIYRRGGRVQAELDHAHNPVVLQHTFWRPYSGQVSTAAETEEALRALEQALLDGRHDALYERDGVVSPLRAIQQGFWPGQRVLTHCPEDPAAALRAMDALAQSLGLLMRTEVFESTRTREALHARSDDATRGGCAVVLWSAGRDAEGVALALSLALQADVSDCVELVARAPVELLRDVALARGEGVCAALKAQGAEVEVLRPEQRRGVRGVDDAPDPRWP